jgi:hypothetical protein
MKKMGFVVMILFAVIFASSFALASDITSVGGTIYNADTQAPIAGASVEVVCHHGLDDNTKTTTSGAVGEYNVLFAGDKCAYGDEVTVSADKGPLTGENDGTVTKKGLKVGCFSLDVGVINVPLIPEFGLLVGTLTAASAIFIFFVVRRK